MIARSFKTAVRCRTLFLMLLPAFVLVIVFSYIPMAGIAMAFQQFRYGHGFFGSPWVGLANFRFFFSSGMAWRVTRNTFLYNIAFLILNTTVQITVAIMISEIGSKWFKRVTQTCLLLPHFISWVVVSSMAYGLFNFENGLINNTLAVFGGNPIDVYGNPRAWIFILPLVNLWKAVGFGSIIYMAAIAGLDAELKDSAEVDGANIFQRIWHITLPGIIPTILILTLLAIGQIFRGNFQLFFQMVGDNGLLLPTTDIIDTYVFRSLRFTPELGMPAAAGLYQSAMSFVTIMLTNYLVRCVDKDYALF
ncbi:MAG: ABC transporter permease subunit [Defluviitaleaceae bacterium]|nr:ABC transporter permease subunit [Defluviitaleaceae bacterium]